MQHSLRDMPVLALAVLCIIFLAHTQSLPEFVIPMPSDITVMCSYPAQAQSEQELGTLSQSDMDSMCSYLAHLESLQRLATSMVIIVEVLLAIAIIILVYWYTQKSDYAVKSSLGALQLKAGRIERFKQGRKARATDAMCANIECLIYYCSLLAEMSGRYAGVPGPKRPQFRDDIVALRSNAAVPAGELERMLESADYLDDRTRSDILAMIDRFRDPVSISGGERMVEVAQYRAVSRSLGPVLTRLRYQLKLAAERPLRRPGPTGEPGGLAVRLDRHTCPPGAPIRMTVKANGQFQRSKIIVTILDEGLDELDKKAEDAPVRALPRNATLNTDMKPRKKLDVGREYIARATCGDLYDEAVFVVENIVPTVRVDRPTCTIGDVIAVTVEDPAAAADGVEKGPAGAARGRRLVVESPHDRTDGCRLRAAGASAGTFCGRIRCVGACGAAPSGRRAWAWGEGAEDVDIACGPDQVIRIRYESEAGEARTAILVKGHDIPSSGSGNADRPAAGESGGGRGSGGGDAEPVSHALEGDEAGRMQGFPEGERGRGR